MLYRILHILIITLVVSCDSIVLNSSSTSEVTKFNESLILNDIVFDTTISQNIQSILSDANDNIYILGHAEGTFKNGIATSSRDIFVAKVDKNSNLIWAKTLSDTSPLISDTSGVELAESFYIDQSSIYIYGTTTSNFAETNSSQGQDLIVTKLDLNGNIIWAKHFGEESELIQKTALSNPALDWSLNETASTIAIGPDSKLYLSFHTSGSMFEVNSSTLTDIGFIKLNSTNGNFENGIQIGSSTAASLSLDTSRSETISQNGFKFDSMKLVAPFTTNGAFKESNTLLRNDSAYVVIDSSLNIVEIKHLGEESFNQYVTSSMVTAGSTSITNNAFRDVIIHSENDYLFFGKSQTGHFIEDSNASSSDSIFVRYTNGSITSIVHYGDNTLPTATSNEEPRKCKEYLNEIYCLLNSGSDLFSSGRDSIMSPTIFKVDDNGNLLSGIRIDSTKIESIEIPIANSAFINEGEFYIKHGQIIFGIIDSSTSNKTGLIAIETF